MESFEEKRVTVMGLGRFGGGVGVTRWLAEQGAKVVVTDLLDADALKKSLGEIDDLVQAGKVELRLGEHREADFSGTDVVVANPAVPMPWENVYLKAAEDAGVPITTEIRLTVERLPNRDHVIGVTGTAGKSTTAAMIAHVLKKCGETVHLGGNIGVSLLGVIDEIKAEDWVVLELSSAQLYWLDQGIGSVEHEGWSPKCAVLTNFSANHLDWHGSVEDYRAAKANIFAYQEVDDFAVLWSDESAKDFAECHSHVVTAEGETDRCVQHIANCIDDLPPDYKAKLSGFDPLGLALPGLHNRRNAEMAVVVFRAMPIGFAGGIESVEGIVESGFYWKKESLPFGDFAGLPHRLQFAGEFGGVRVFNDSKCTTPGACALAVGAFDEEGECGAGGVGGVHLICGGYDKGVDLSAMIEAAAKCAGVYTIGATGERIAEAVNGVGGEAAYCEDLERAVEAAAGRLKKDGGGRVGGVLLLSPGCASWGQFTNYEERGERFIRGAEVALANHR